MFSKRKQDLYKTGFKTPAHRNMPLNSRNCVELLWGVGVVLLGIGCFSDEVGAGDIRWLELLLGGLVGEEDDRQLLLASLVLLISLTVLLTTSRLLMIVFSLQRLHYSSWPDFSNSDLVGFRNITLVIFLISQIKDLTYL